MAPKPNLWLQDPFDAEDADIGDLSTGLSVLSNTSSSFTVPSTSKTNTSTTYNAYTPVEPVLSASSDFDLGTPPARPTLARKASLGQLVLASPSSPELVRSGLGTGPLNRRLSRSATLPRLSQLGSPHVSKGRKAIPEFTSLDVDEDVKDKIRRWILGIAIVDFDVDDGPVVDSVHPPFNFSPEECENIAFSAFPDSLQFDQGSSTHSFRIRDQANRRPVGLKNLDNSNRPETESDGFIYGYSHFMQRRNSDQKRGYEQRSLVFLTHHQYPSLFSSIASIFGPLFQAHGLPMLEAACHNVASWSDPTPGSRIELGFLGSVIQVELPRNGDEQQLTEVSGFKEKFDPRVHILASTPPLQPPPIRLFEASLPHLWSIWECLVLCEPLLIFGLSPVQTSQAVWWFRDLVRPLPSHHDLRPYFTIHDTDHSSLVNKLPPRSGLLLGVTNPFFERSCNHWPHVLSLGQKKTANSAAGLNSAKALASAAHIHAGPAAGWKTKTHKRYISKDRTLLKQLEDSFRQGEVDQLTASLSLRRHFSSRTSQILIPLTRYLNTLIPTPEEVETARCHARRSGPGSKTAEHLQLKPFNTSAFFASLKAGGTPLPFKSTSKRTEFYERWLKTPTFGMWLAQQEQVVKDVLKSGLED